MELLLKHFPELDAQQHEQFAKLQPLYHQLNEQVNVISRKDIDNLYERHVLHSLAIAKLIQFVPGTKVLDVGTGGGFPGIPLAILFPECEFFLADSIGKKIRGVKALINGLSLSNATAEQIRVEQLPPASFDFAVSRAVAPVITLWRWSAQLVHKEQKNSLKNGFLCLKGGDLREEFADFKHHSRSYEISKWFEGEFFETKKLIHIPV